MKPAVLVVGAGSIGTRHLANLRSLGVERLAVCEPDAERRSGAVRNGVQAFADLAEALQEFRATAGLVCTPPVFHVEPALALVRAGADVFLEKPVAATREGVDDLVHATEEAGRIVQVGYNLRFHPVLVAVKRLLEQGAIGRVFYAHARFGQYLPDWRPAVDYRKSYTARADLGGGILLDASHEIDYVTWLLGPPETVACAAGRASALEVDVEDSATLLLGYAGGLHAVVHVDFARRGYQRTLDIVGETGSIVADIGAGTVRVERDRHEWEAVEVPPGDMYRAELEHFLTCIAHRRSPLIDLGAGRRTLEIVLLAKASAADGLRRALR